MKTTATATKEQIEITKQKRRAYNQAHKAEHAESARRWRAANPDKVKSYARNRAGKRRTRPNKQWEITLTDGMKQYVLGHTQGEAVSRWLRYSHSEDERNAIASVREYGLMPKSEGWQRWHGRNGNEKANGSGIVSWGFRRRGQR